MKTSLYEAVLKGDVNSFLELVKQDPMIMDKSPSSSSSCCHQWPSLLHVAAEKGHLEMVKALLQVRRSTCLARDQDGRNPIHLAAIEGHVNVVEELYDANPLAAQERTINGDTILHLCVKHNQLKALQALLKLTDDDDGGQLLNSMDSNGNTVLHLAMTSKQHEMVEYLLGERRMKKNVVNNNKMSIVDIYLKQSRKNNNNNNRGNELDKIGKSLKSAKAKRGKDARNEKADAKRFEEQRTSLMVVASLIAAAAFQVGINPPGGDWQENGKSTVSLMRAISTLYSWIQISNGWALISSLSVILLLISGLPCKRLFIRILRTILWFTVTATMLTYLFSVILLNNINAMSDTNTNAAAFTVLSSSIISWLALTVLIFFGHVLRFICKLLNWRTKECIRKFWDNFYSKLSFRRHHQRAHSKFVVLSP